jgi:DNA mismatch repair protein MutS
MKNFNIDDQTFKDLNVFTEQYGSNSIFNLFKGTRTIGGRERLRQMMQSPSADFREITLRRDAIKYFRDHSLNLDIKNEELDLIEFYLKIDKKKFKNNLLDSLADYATRNSSNDYYIIKTGLRYLIKLTKYIFNFIKDHSSKQTPEHLIIIFQQIELIVENGFLKQAILLNENRLKFLDVSKLDRAFRGKEKENIQTLLQLIYELDVFENIAITAASKGLSFPSYSSDDNLKVKLTGLFHPGITNPVKNNIFFDINRNIIFLTGSNMAGKSSLLKSIGLVIYLSHLGFPVPADAMETTVFNGLVTTINLPDDVNHGLSHYYSEVKRLKKVSQTLLENDKMFVIFDELFRGTNVKDAFEASSLIISELSNIKNSAFLISTHIVELATELEKFGNISFRYLATYFENNRPVFTYQLTEGVSKDRLGMYIVQNEGIVDMIRKACNNTLKSE